MEQPYFQVSKVGSFLFCNTTAYKVKLLNAFLCPMITFALLHYSQPFTASLENTITALLLTFAVVNGDYEQM